MGKREITTKRAESQLRAIHGALNHVLSETATTQPADQVLAGYLRNHREYGSRDRRLINGVVYGVFRWWGWLRMLAPPSVAAAFGETGRTGTAVSEAGDPESPQAWSRFLLAALLLDGHGDKPLSHYLAGVCGWEQADYMAAVGQESEDARFRSLLTGLGLPGDPPQWDVLVRDWVVDAVDAPRPFADLVQQLQQRPPLWLRTQKGTTEENVAALQDAGLNAVPHPELSSAISLGQQRVNLREIEAFRRGRVVVQDIASQVVAASCAPAAGQRWWDVCAGGGGKSLHLARLLQNTGGEGVLATDIRKARLRELRRRAENSGARGITIRRWDGQTCPEADAAFDGVLVDAPCSGSGTWARNPWTRWMLAPGDLDAQATRQAEILDVAAPYVAPGGLLVYATCSFFTRENQDVCREFLDAHDNFEPQPFDNPLDGTTSDGMLQIWPSDGNGNAMFVAQFRRR